ncbi:hypothetical protein QO011_002687 [Labrys wisconsinensis]|uniref:Uncharacterized protein n=2 Tax=Labrys wisconsinensis TaxID=425677 RepID=A0ABU0J5Y8_9HYPH|nr:hypothetical protein [Labrys wisconsinensis]
MTAQCPDILFIRGNRHELCATPLDDYMRRMRKERRPQFVWESSACWRGYIASWEVRDGALYLIEIKGCMKRNDEFVDASLADAFPRWKPPVLASWVTDTLRCPEGRLLSYTHAGFASDYARDRLLHVEKGRVVAEWLRLNPPEPIWYRIDAEGKRTRFEGPHPEDEMLEDLFRPEETPEGSRYWGLPPEQDDEAAYMIAAEIRRPLVSET